MERKLEVLTKEFVETERGLMDDIFKKVGFTDLVEDVDTEDLALLMRSLKFMNQANEIITAQASLLCDVNEKLDQLLRRQES